VSSLASRLCFLAAIGLLTWAGVQMALSGNATSSQMGLVIEEPERNLGELPAGMHNVVFRLRNTTGHPHRIIGLNPG